MATPTYTLIASSTVGAGGASTIDFTSIPSTYTDLLIKYSTKSTTASTGWVNLQISYNGNTSSYTWLGVYGYSSTNVGSNTNTSTYSRHVGVVPEGNNGTFGNGELYIPNYAGNKNKSLFSDSVDEINSSSGNILSLDTNLWANTSAITSISFNLFGGEVFAQYSSIYLYGIKNS